MKKNQNILSRFFGVILSKKTYLNLLYLFLAFPLGMLYFIFLVVGFSLGFALLIVLVGAAILAFVVAGWWGFANFERYLAIHLLDEPIPPMTRTNDETRSMGESILVHLSNPVTWKSLLYLFLKFPLGIFTFIVLVLMFSLTAFFSTAIFTFSFFNLDVALSSSLAWRIDTIGEALLALPIGMLLGFISLHIFNALARISGRFAHTMLSDSSPTKQAATVMASEKPAPHPTGVQLTGPPAAEKSALNEQESQVSDTDTASLAQSTSTAAASLWEQKTDTEQEPSGGEVPLGTADAGEKDRPEQATAWVNESELKDGLSGEQTGLQAASGPWQHEIKQNESNQAEQQPHEDDPDQA